MSDKRAFKTEAVVLSTIDYGESDKIVSFYSADFGKIKGITKGAKRSRKRFANALEPFTEVSLIFWKSRIVNALNFVESCAVLEHHPKVRADIISSVLASYMVELVDGFTLEGKRSTELFTLLSRFLKLLADNPDNGEHLTRIFEIKFLKIMGYEPQVEGCVKCQQPIGDGFLDLQFDHISGGARCPDCNEDDGIFVNCSAGALKTIALGRDIDFDKVDQLFSVPSIARECEAMLAIFIRHLLGREPRSRAVLKQIQNLKNR